MIAIKTDLLANFIQVTHIGSGDLFKLHKDDLPKLGTPAKVAVYENQPVDFLPPSTQHPKGHYRSKVKYFVAQYLTAQQVIP